MLACQELTDRSSTLPADEFGSSLHSQILKQDISPKILPDLYDFLRHLIHFSVRPTETIYQKISVVKKHFKKIIPKSGRS